MKNHLYAIYQMPIAKLHVAYGASNRDFGLNLKDEVTEVDISKEGYKLIYNGSIPAVESEKLTLDELFRIFNVDHPEDYRGRSLSVGDIVVINCRAFHCQSLGWKEIKLAD